jgi:outer membrane protein assembly factor BamD
MEFLRMIQRSTPIRTLSSARSFFPTFCASFSAGLAVAALAAASLTAQAQTTPDAPTAPAAAADTTQMTAPMPSATLSNQPDGKSRKQKEEKVVQTKDTKKEVKRYKKDNPLEGMDAKLPDKSLYDKAMDSIKHGRFDVARLDLQTLLNTYPDSQFQMRAKLAIADSWYKEGGTAALTQAEQEYRDFIVFYPNAPEAAEAQMRIGDIYFKEMDKPDRDHTKAAHAEAEYRLMLQQFPDSPRVTEAAQRLREVQESLASAEADVAAFYGSRLNYAAAIARYQTVADSFPLYSHMDDVLIGLGDAYEAQARFYRGLKLPEAAKAQLVKLYDDQATAAYRKVVLEHSAAPHVEDARDRLAEMHQPIPTPTPEQSAASAALENSRGQYTLSKRAILLLMHRPDTVEAATIGAPPLEDGPRTLAPAIVRRNINEFNSAVNPGAAGPQVRAAAAAPTATSEPAATAAEAPAAQQPASAAPLALQDVPSANGAPAGPAVNTSAPAAVPAPAGGGNGLGVQIVQPSADSPAVPAQPSANPPAFPGTSGAPQAGTDPATTPSNAPSAANGYGFAPAKDANSQPLAPTETAPAAPEAINEAAPGSQPAAQNAPAGKKNPKPAFDKSDESSSKHKKKKGLDKLNPF